LKWRQDLTDSGQEGDEAQEKVTNSRTSGRKRKQLAKRGDGFMDSRFDDKSIVSPVVSSDKEHKNPKLVVLYQNIFSLRKKKQQTWKCCYAGS